MTSISLATLARRAADLGNPLPCSDDTQLWFSEHPADLELAKAMCETCPLRRPCLAGAIDRAEPFGVWGGEIFEKGRIIAYKRPRALVDEYVLMIHPLILGQGRRLLPEGTPAELRLAESVTTTTGVIIGRYQAR